MQLAVLLSPYYSSVPLVAPWDTHARDLIEDLLRERGFDASVPIQRVSHSIVHRKHWCRTIHGVAWEARRFLEGDGPRVDASFLLPNPNGS